MTFEQFENWLRILPYLEDRKEPARIPDRSNDEAWRDDMQADANEYYASLDE